MLGEILGARYKVISMLGSGALVIPILLKTLNVRGILVAYSNISRLLAQTQAFWNTFGSFLSQKQKRSKSLVDMIKFLNCWLILSRGKSFT